MAEQSLYKGLVAGSIPAPTTKIMQNSQKYDRDWYAGRSKEQKDHKVAIQRARRISIRKTIDDYKRTHACACGESEICCLDFHHTEDNKEVCIANAIRNGWNLARIMMEISKCILICANCHRKLHSKLNSDSMRAS